MSETNWNGVDMHLDEGQRQMMLLALAKLAIERPGWVWALEQIAVKMDNVDGEHAILFRQFMKLHDDSPHPSNVPG